MLFGLFGGQFVVQFEVDVEERTCFQEGNCCKPIIHQIGCGFSPTNVEEKADSTCECE
jgi:hypothetical protein